MSPRSVVALVCGVGLAACSSQSPTAAKTARPSDLFIVYGWQRGSLPFVPVGISDSGVIVGTTKSNVAVRYAAGTTTILAAPPPQQTVNRAAVIGIFPPPGEFTPPYSAVGIATNGHIVGTINGGAPLIWTNPAVTPQVVTVAGVTLRAAAMNANHMIVGMSTSGAFRWSPAGGFLKLPNPTGYTAFGVTYVSNSGWVAGYADPTVGDGAEALVRWSPSGVVSMMLPVGHELPENQPSGIDEAGDIMSTSGGTTIEWTVGGGVITFTNAPSLTRTQGWSSLGRIVGHTIGTDDHPWTLFNGGLTWLSQPSPADEADIPVGVNSCGNIVARRVNADSVLDSGYVWNRTLTCDQGGILASRAAPSLRP